MNRRHFLYRMGMAVAFVASADLAPAGEWLRELKAPLLVDPVAIPATTMAELNELMHAVYMDAVVPAIKSASPLAEMFAGGPYEIAGEQLVFNTDLTYSEHY